MILFMLHLVINKAVVLFLFFFVHVIKINIVCYTIGFFLTYAENVDRCDLSQKKCFDYTGIFFFLIFEKTF